MTNLTLNLLINLMKDYDYELSKDQAVEIIELLDDFKVNDRFTIVDIEMCTDYVVNGHDSIFANYY